MKSKLALGTIAFAFLLGLAQLQPPLGVDAVQLSGTSGVTQTRPNPGRTEATRMPTPSDTAAPILSSVATPVAATPTITVSDLQTEKLRLEIEKLRGEVHPTNTGIFLQAGTLLVALLAAAVSFWSAWKSQQSQIRSLKIQTKQFQKNRISDLLKELGSEEISVKVAAIQALSSYREAVPFLVNLLQVREDPMIVSTVRSALGQHPDRALSELIDLTIALRERHKQLAFKLIALGLDEDAVAERLLLSSRTLSRWMEEAQFERVEQLTQMEFEDASPSGESEEEHAAHMAQLAAGLQQEWRNLFSIMSQVNVALEQIIKRLASRKEAFSLKGAYVPGIKLDHLDLSGWSFQKAILWRANFAGADCRQADFGQVSASECNFRGAALNDAILDQATLDGTRFGTARMQRSSLIDCVGYSTRFPGAKLQGARIENAYLEDCRFTRAFAIGTSFRESTLFRAKFSLAICNDAVFDGADLRGAVMNGILAPRASFREVVFGGTSWLGAKFYDASFNGATFHKMSEYKGAVLEGSSWSNVDFKEGNEGFVDFVRACLESSE